MQQGIEFQPALPSHESFLWLMLTYAASMGDGSAAEIERAKANEYLRTYVDGWGTRVGDLGLIAINAQSEPIGAAWVRLPYGASPFHVGSTATPELATAVLPSYRGQGVGSALMCKLIEKCAGVHEAIALSVRAENPALRFYERLGFVEAGRMENRAGGVSVAMELQVSQNRVNGRMGTYCSTREDNVS